MAWLPRAIHSSCPFLLPLPRESRKPQHPPAQAFLCLNWQYDPVLASEIRTEITEKSFQNTLEKRQASWHSPLSVGSPASHLRSGPKTERCSSPPATTRPRPHAKGGEAVSRNLSLDGISELLSELTHPRLLFGENKVLIGRSFHCPVACSQTQSN